MSNNRNASGRPTVEQIQKEIERYKRKRKALKTFGIAVGLVFVFAAIAVLLSIFVCEDKLIVNALLRIWPLNRFGLIR